MKNTTAETLEYRQMCNFTPEKLHLEYWHGRCITEQVGLEIDSEFVDHLRSIYSRHGLYQEAGVSQAGTVKVPTIDAIGRMLGRDIQKCGYILGPYIVKSMILNGVGLWAPDPNNSTINTHQSTVN